MKLKTSTVVIQPSASKRFHVRPLVLVEAMLIGLSMVGLLCIYADLILSARIKAQDITCSHHVKDLSRAILLYVDDWDGTLPTTNRWLDSAQTHLLNVAAAEVAHCPATTSHFGYAINNQLGMLSVAKINAPMETVLLFESDSNRSNESGGANLVTTENRHGGRLWFSFTDGHASSRRPSVGWSELCWKP